MLGAEPGYMVWNRSKNEFTSVPTFQDVDQRFNIDLDLGFACQVLPRWTVEVRGMAGLKSLYEEWGNYRGRTYKTDQKVGHLVMVQLGLSYDLMPARK